MNLDRTVLAVALGVTAGLTLLACLDITPVDQRCVDACATARRCGLLPSALGGRVGASQAANEADCVARCLASDGRTAEVEGLLQVLGNADDYGTDSLCQPGGVASCEELIEDLAAEPTTNELEVTTRLTVRMASAVSFVADNSIEDWCCFDYDFDFDQGDGLDELDAVDDMFQPTLACLTTVRQKVECLIPLLDPMADPMGTPVPCPLESGEMSDDPMTVCGDLAKYWMPMPEMAEGPMEPDPSTDPCLFARMSTRLQELDVSDATITCDFETMQALRMELLEVTDDWNLQVGGLLVDEDGAIRALEDIRTRVEGRIRDELTRPLGFLEEACEELFEELGADACETLDRQTPPPRDCPGGPVCTPADCLAESPECDASRCLGELSPPSQDCGFFGIDEIKLGYKTNEGLEIFGEPVVGCTTRGEISTVIEGVGVGVIKPVAVVSGRLTASTDDGSSDGAFSWTVEGSPRWVSAGEAEAEVPSPLVGQLQLHLTNPLEFLGWVPARLPTGLACDNQPDLCEGLFNDNCDDGRDNDGDGVTDLDSAWCDELMLELVDRCVVTIPGEQAPMACRSDEGPEPGEPPP
ncbi:MAG: hypothetical protein KDK70_03205 [Myxococcales bacterium]|nr:hypothetical protein [Myxococcales bacterium]